MIDTENRTSISGAHMPETEMRHEKHDDAMQDRIVTQNVPDDTFRTDGPIIPSSDDAAALQRELEQDVTKTNPSVESMDSRG